MMATGCLYDAVVALGKSHLELRRNLPYLLSEYVEIDKVNRNTCVLNSTSVFTSSKKYLFLFWMGIFLKQQLFVQKQ